MPAMKMENAEMYGNRRKSYGHETYDYTNGDAVEMQSRRNVSNIGEMEDAGNKNEREEMGKGTTLCNTIM